MYVVTHYLGYKVFVFFFQGYKKYLALDLFVYILIFSFHARFYFIFVLFFFFYILMNYEYFRKLVHESP